jgi:hypothetical protein
LQRKGYRAWTQGAEPKRSKNNVEYSKGGMCVAIRQDVRGFLIDSFLHEDGEAMLLNIGNAHLSFAWRRPQNDREVFDDIMSQWYGVATESCTPYMCIGDFNDVPDDNPMINAGAFLRAVRTSQELVPSRWKGNRCIDWALFNDASVQCDMTYSPEKVSDHKVVLFQVSWPVRHANAQRLVPTATLCRPANTALADWRAAVEHAYGGPNTLPEASTEEEWRMLNQRAEQALRLAQHALGSGFSEQTNLRPKGSLPSFKTSKCKANSDQSRIRFRRLARFVGRVHEILWKRQHGCRDVTLEEKIWKSWPSSVPWNNFHEALEAGNIQLESLLQKEYSDNCSAWKKRMANAKRDATNWLHGRKHVLPAMVYEEDCAGNKTYSDSHHSALKMIAAFWRQVWNRATSCEEFERAASQNLTSPHGPLCEESWLPTAEELQKRVAVMTGSPGIDGWSTDELAALPSAYWQDFCSLFIWWCEREEFPAVWKHSRMVMLPKTDVEPSTGAIPVSKMRPISILPLHYRLLASCFARRENTRQWLHRIAPSVCHGALQGRSATDALAALQEQFAKPQAIMVSLDMKQCFDRMNPDVALPHLQHAGFPHQWCAFLRWTWTDQHRWLQMGPIFLPEAQLVHSSVPQGCPLAPLALVCVLREAVHDVGQTLQNHGEFHQSVFLDDRAIRSFTHLK